LFPKANNINENRNAIRHGKWSHLYARMAANQHLRNRLLFSQLPQVELAWGKTVVANTAIHPSVLAKKMLCRTSQQNMNSILDS
jgi:hypothetical protein